MLLGTCLGGGALTAKGIDDKGNVTVTTTLRCDGTIPPGMMLNSQPHGVSSYRVVPVLQGKVTAWAMAIVEAN